MRKIHAFYLFLQDEMKGLSKMALCVSPRTSLCGIAAFSETATYILNVIASLLIQTLLSTFIHKYYFRNLLTMTPTERHNNKKEWRSEARWGFLCGLGSVHKELCKCSDGASDS